MIPKKDFQPVAFELPAQLRPIVGLDEGMKLIGHNLPTNHTTPPTCLIEFNGYLREHILLRRGDNYEPFEIPERIACLTKLEKFDPKTILKSTT